MALTASVLITQGGDCSRFVVKDNSNYEEATEPREGFSDRKLIIYKSDGSVYRKPGQTADEIPFSYADYPSDEIEIDGLTQDYALHVVMTLTPITPASGSIYTVTSKFALVCYTNNYLYERAKKMMLNPRYEQNNNYVADTERIAIAIATAPKAAASDAIESAQIQLDYARNIYEKNPTPY